MSLASEIRSMTDSQVEDGINEAKKELFNLRFQWEIGQLEDYNRIRILKICPAAPIARVGKKRGIINPCL